MSTQAILNHLPKNTKGILSKELVMSLPVLEWQKQGSTWDILLTEKHRHQLAQVLLTLRPKVVEDMVEIHNETYGEHRASYPPSITDLAEILKDVFVLDLAGVGEHSLNVTSESKMAELRFCCSLSAQVDEITKVKTELLKGFEFAVSIGL